MLFKYKNCEVEVSEGRLEVCRLQEKFYNFALTVLPEVRQSFKQNFQDLRSFVVAGDDWAHEFIDRGAKLAVEELIALDCYDMDYDTWKEKYIDYSLWEVYTKEAKAFVRQLDEAEEEAEQQRQKRTSDLGDTLSSHKVSYDNHSVHDSIDGGNIAVNMALMAGSGLFNMAARSHSKNKMEASMKEIFESAEFLEKVERGIVDSIEFAYYKLVNYCEEHGLKSGYSLISHEDEDRAQRLLNNLMKGLVPEEKIDKVIVDVLATNPHNSFAYYLMLKRDGDENGTVSDVAALFHFGRLEILKKKLVSDMVNEADLKNEESTLAAKKHILDFANNKLRVSSEKINVKRIDDALEKFDKAARTFDGVEYATRELAQGMRNVSECYKSLQLETEAEAISAKEKLASCMKENSIESFKGMEELNCLLAKFDLAYRTVDGIEFPTRQEADSQKELLHFYNNLSLATEEEAMASKQQLLEKSTALNVNGDWLVERVDKVLADFDKRARTTFGIEFPTREEARQALASKETFFLGIQKLISKYPSFGSFSDNQIQNARKTIGISDDVTVYALCDLTNLKTGHSAVCVTSEGIAWNDVQAGMLGELKETKLGKMVMGKLAGFGFMKKQAQESMAEEVTKGLWITWGDFGHAEEPAAVQGDTSCIICGSCKQIKVGMSNQNQVLAFLKAIYEYAHVATCF